MENLPIYVSLLLGATTLATGLLFYKATKSVKVVAVVLIWLVIVAVAALSCFFLDTKSVPPHFAFLLGPPVLAIAFLFVSSKGRKWIDGFGQKWLTWLHVVRIPVEVVLLWLCIYEKVPQLMTFEGRNFDIVSGLTAPFVAYFGYTKVKLSRAVLLGWNFICLGLLLNIVLNAVLSAPFSFQRFGFDQPNIALFYFPFVWLPGFIVPVVLLSHLVNIRQLLIKSASQSI
jgi:hypothetical protein